MLLEKRIISHTGKYSADAADVSITFSVITDDWRDGPLAIAIQGTSDKIIDETGKVCGWLKRGEPYCFGHEKDERIVASEVEVTDRKPIDADNEYDITILQDRIRFDRDEHRHALIQWTVKQNFKKPSFDNQEPESDSPGVDDLFTLKYGKEWIDVPFTRDAQTGQLIVNSAGDPFVPTPAMKKVIRTYVLTRKERKNNLKLYERYENAVNADTWYGARPGTVLMESILPNWDGSIFTVDYNFKYNPNGWGEKFLDTGFNEVHEEEVKHVDKNGNMVTATIRKRYPINAPGGELPVEEPVKLDGNGQVPIHRKEAKYQFLDDNGNPITDQVTGGQMYYETGEPVLQIDENGKEKPGVTIPYHRYPGVFVPFDPPSQQINDNWVPIPIEKQHFFWKYKSINFDVLKIPNPYIVQPKPKPVFP